MQEVERASFVPVVFSATGGADRAASALLKRIAALSAEKTGEPYAMVMALLRCRLGFGLLRASVACLAVPGGCAASMISLLSSQTRKLH